MTPGVRLPVFLVALLCGAVVFAFSCTPGSAQSYPDRPIRLFVPGAPGGPTDLPARLVSQILPTLGQPGVVEHRPGAGGAIGARFVASSPADGYSLLAANTSVLAVIPATSASAGYDPTKDFAAVAKVSESYQILVLNPASPWKTVGELVAYAKANPGTLTFAHTGPGGLPHLTGELFKALAGVDILGVSYKSGGESVTALLGRQVDMTFESVTILLPLIRDGKLRALAITSRERTPLASDLPTMIEAGVPNYEVTTFNGIVAPAGTPPQVVGLLNKAINDGLRTPENQATIAQLGAISNLGSPEDFSTFIVGQYRKWLQVAKSARISVD
jgi:tripartite-type tricarboxylate transporter receptor subunit TctC